MRLSKPYSLALLVFLLLTGCREDEPSPTVTDTSGGSGKKGGGGEETPPAIDLRQATLKTIGVKVDSDFSENGAFEVQMLLEGYNEPSADIAPIALTETPPETNQKSPPEKAKDEVEAVSCEVTSGPIACTCGALSSTVPSPKPLDIALDIDSSGSNMHDHEDRTASDPTNLRLEAASGIVDSLLTADNRIAAFSFGSRYCVAASESTCTDFYRALPQVGTVTYKFADYTATSGRDTLKENVKQAVWQANNGTPIFDSCIEVIAFTTSSVTRDSAKMMILFSDGEPINNIYTESDCCRNAEMKGVKLLTVGYGQASIHDGRTEPEAVRVLQNLASCGGGSYLAIEDIATIGEKTKEMSRGISEGHLDSPCSLSAESLTQLDPATPVSGKVKVKFKKIDTPKEASFSFLPSGRKMAPTLQMRPRRTTDLK